MADMLIPKKSNGSSKGKEDNTDKLLRVIEYILGKFKFVIEQNE